MASHLRLQRRVWSARFRVPSDVRDAFDRRLQDWRTWLESSTIDSVCPMAYTPDASTFASQIASVRGLAGTRAVWAGIGAYPLTPDQTVQHILIARKQGADGFALFSYDSLTAARTLVVHTLRR